MYGLGQGVAQDYVRAHMWFNIAATAGDKDSVKNRDIAASKMTPQQIEQAQRMARECMASNFKKCD
jgi:TPR repeat protein